MVGGTYGGLSLARSVSIDLPGDGVLVRRDLAEPLLRAQAQPAASAIAREPVQISADPGGSSSKATEPNPGPRRFFGVVRLDATRPGPQIAQIAQAIVAERSHVGGTKVTLKFDIDAEAPADFPSDVVDVVSANAKTLKFEQSGFS
jgi:hypothetical protein